MMPDMGFPSAGTPGVMVARGRTYGAQSHVYKNETLSKGTIFLECAISAEQIVKQDTIPRTGNSVR